MTSVSGRGRRNVGGGALAWGGDGVEGSIAVPGLRDAFWCVSFERPPPFSKQRAASSFLPATQVSCFYLRVCKCVRACVS